MCDPDYKPAKQRTRDSSNEKAKGAVIKGLIDRNVLRVRQMPTAKAMWSELERLHINSLLKSQLYLQKKLFSTNMKEGGNL